MPVLSVLPALPNMPTMPVLSALHALPNMPTMHVLAVLPALPNLPTMPVLAVLPALPVLHVRLAVVREVGDVAGAAGPVGREPVGRVRVRVAGA